MSTIMKKHLPATMVAILAFILVFTMAFTLTSSVATADDAATGTLVDTLTIGHISDIHYFPLDYCYQDVTADDYKTSDFYNSLTGDTKLVIESGAILAANIKRLIEDATLGKAPLYIFASGDLTKNGERLAEIDVANALRYMQNKIRSLGMREGIDYSNFQVFATAGNHDLYNGSGALYNTETGAGWKSECVTAAQFALIYSGLGYPEHTFAELCSIYPESYWSTGYTNGYVESTLSSSVEITYFNEHMQNVYDKNIPHDSSIAAEYAAIGDGNNAISFAVKVKNSGYSFFVIDATDREATTSLVPSIVNAADFAAYPLSNTNYYIKSVNSDGQDVYTETRDSSAITAAIGNGTAYRNTGLSHLTGGRITAETFAFLENYINSNSSADAIDEMTYVASFHQNLLPHFEQEDDILKDFVLYNWEYTAKRFAELGIRVSLTGHQHASDVAYYTDAQGRTIYDMETGSSVSNDSPIRYITIGRYNVDGKLAEKIDSSLYILPNFKEVASRNITSYLDGTTSWNEDAYTSAYQQYLAADAANKHAAWETVINANPDFYVNTVFHKQLIEDGLSYNEYIYEEIYGQLLTRLLDHFLNDGLYDTVMGLVNQYLEPENSILKSLLNGAFSAYTGVIYKMAVYIVNTVWTGLYDDNDGNGYGDYEFDGVIYDNVIDWVKAVAWDVVNMEFGTDAAGGKLTLGDMAVAVLLTSCNGNELNSTLLYKQTGCTSSDALYQEGTMYDEAFRLRFQAGMQDFVAQCESGQLISSLLNKLLTPLFYDDDSLLKTLLSYRFDFTSEEAGLTQAEINQLAKRNEEGNITSGLFRTVNSLLKSLYKTEISLDETNFVLQDIINGAMPLVSSLLDQYLGFSVSGDNVVDIVQGLLDDYVTDSFCIGLGGIAKNIVVAFATDDTQDIADITDPSKTLTLEPYNDYAVVSVESVQTKMSYISGKTASTDRELGNWELEIAANRKPGNLTANFDTVDGQTTFTISYYTDEDIFARFEYRAKGETEWTTVSGAHWDIFNDSERETYYATSGINIDNLYSVVAVDNVSIETLTSPAYIPLIDLGLLCIQHSATYYELNDAEVYYTCKDRDNAPANSVLYRNRHTITVSGLTAGTTYEYRAFGEYFGTGDTVLASNAIDDESVFTFTTAPDATVDSFEFLAIADLQGMVQSMYDNSLNAFNAINADATTSNYDFILNAGDMTDNGKNYYQWQFALNTMVDTFANTSIFNAAGNHEAGSYAMSKFFNYTQPSDVSYNSYGEAEQDYYSFNYGNALFIVLDTNDADKDGLGKTQYDWMKNTLENSIAKWKFVLMHKSLYSTGAHANDNEVVAMRAQLVPIFQENNVNIVFGGHDHVYAEAPVGDVLYVTLGTIGTKFYEYTNDNATVESALDYSNTLAHTLTSQTFGYVKIDGDTLSYNGYSYVDGKLQSVENGTIEYFKNSYSDFNGKITLSFFTGRIADLNVYSPILPKGFTFKYVANGKAYSAIDQIRFNAASTDVDIYLIAPNGQELYADTFTFERENYALGIALWTIGCVAVVAGIVVAIMLSKKKKVAMATTEEDNLSDDSDDNDSSMQEMTEEITDVIDNKTADNDEEN